MPRKKVKNAQKKPQEDFERVGEKRMEEKSVEKYLEAIGANLNAFQKAIIRTAMSYDDLATAMSRMTIAARRVSKSWMQMAQFDANIKWLSAPRRVKHLAKHAKKMRVRKKNLRRIYG